MTVHNLACILYKINRELGLHFVLDRRDPEHWRTLRFRKEQRDREYLQGQIGEATYLLSVSFLGYTDREARTELGLLKMEKRQ